MSDLLKHYLALEDGDLAKRTQGAALKYAHYLLGTEDPDPTDLAFAVMVLAEPFRTWLEQQIEVVSNVEVLRKITVSPDGQRSFSQAVPDQDITYVIESTWSKVAAKYVVRDEPAPDAGGTVIDGGED